MYCSPCNFVKMVKPRKKHKPEPLEPHESVPFHLKDGRCIYLQIFRDVETGVELVQCDLCDLFFYSDQAMTTNTPEGSQGIHKLSEGDGEECETATHGRSSG